MSEFRRRLMMVGGGEPLPISNGLISWLDCNDIDSNSNRWYCSQSVQALYPGFNVQFSTRDNIIVSGRYLESTGADGGASARIYGGKTCDNPFYAIGASSNPDATFELVMNGVYTNTDQSEQAIFGGNYVSRASQWRWQVRITNQGVMELYAHNGSAWGVKLLGVTVVGDGNPHHVVYSKNGSTISFYVDGALDNQAVDSSLRLNTAQNANLMGVGRYDIVETTASTHSSAGKYYSFSIYNRALSATEVLQNKQAYFKRYNLT